MAVFEVCQAKIYSLVMWQSKYFPTPTVHSVPGEYPLLLPVVGTAMWGIPGVLALLTFSRDGRWEAAAGLEVT